MQFSIIWSKFSENQLDKIFEYYEKRASLKVSKSIVNGIIKETEKLIKTPNLGQEEEALKNRSIRYRYLVYKKYKIIYSIDIEENVIKIADVFDTRQNPPKLKRNT
ncbi:type II toxin-antitoxin system RelE/ParE family toxin [bacterium]|nr:type II toxin-antitoxin system RelE/ParE family toxin [bacterium]